MYCPSKERFCAVIMLSYESKKVGVYQSSPDYCIMSHIIPSSSLYNITSGILGCTVSITVKFNVTENNDRTQSNACTGSSMEK